jgi:hypothetical protein
MKLTFAEHVRARYLVSFADASVPTETIFMGWIQTLPISAGMSPKTALSLSEKPFTHRQSHPCPGMCATSGICHIETAPQSVEVTFTGRHESFQYTKVSKCNLLAQPNLIQDYQYSQGALVKYDSQ